MRLLNIDSLEFSEPRQHERPPYAIASHRWQEEEITYQEVREGHNKKKKGYRKVEDFAKYVRENVPTVKWLWIDTCCINKENATELSKAINLMFKWYRNAEVCIAYLPDVNTTQIGGHFLNSEWFERGWTLQELIAPRTVVFVTQSWQVIGNKGASSHNYSGTLVGTGLEDYIAAKTGIPEEVLHDYDASLALAVHTRLKWMEGRKTSEEEDMSYGLYGILGVTPGANYGEGMAGAQERLLAAVDQRSSRDTQQESRYLEMAEWLSAPDPWTNHDVARQRYESETCTWFLESAQYEDWKGCRSRHLWLHGNPGSGKTILFSTVVDDVHRYCESAPNAACAFFYFSFSDNHKQSCVDLLRSIIAQLARREPGLSMLRQAYEKPKQRKSPGPRDLQKIATSSASSYEEVFLLVDALDECPEAGDIRRNVLLELIDLCAQAKQVRIFATSRDVADIRQSMNVLGAVVIPTDVRFVNQDIRRCISAQLSRDVKLSRLVPSTRILIEDTLSQKADGMFQWADCQLEVLKRSKSTKPKTVEAILTALPATLDETYARILLNIEECDRQEALTLLRWVAYAPTPLSLIELAEATIIDIEGEGAVDFENRGCWEDTLQILSGLVTTEDSSKRYRTDEFSRPKPLVIAEIESPRTSGKPGIMKDTKIKLAHFSVREYLESGRILESNVKQFHLCNDLGQRLLAQSCLTYIMCYSTSSQRTSTDHDFLHFPLLKYAARSWFYHSSFGKTGEVHKEALFLRTTNVVHSWLLIYQPDHKYKVPFQELEAIGSGLYYASYLGLAPVVRALLDHGADVNAKCGKFDTALQAACVGGHEAVAQSLIHAGADINAHGSDHRTSLQTASWTGHLKLTQLLLRHGAEIITDNNNMTALHYAILSRREDIAELMLCANMPIDMTVKRGIWMSMWEHGERNWKRLDDPDIPTSCQGLDRGLTPLHYAALVGSVTMTRFCLARGADPGALSEYGETPLHLAVKRDLHGPDWASGKEDHWNDPVFRIENALDCVNEDLENGEYYVMEEEVETARAEILDILCQHSRADVSAQDCHGASLLHCIRYGSRYSASTLNALSKWAIDVNSCDSMGRTALHLACLERDIQAIQFLVDHEADLQATDANRGSCIHYAARSGDEATIELTLQLVSQAGLIDLVKAKDDHKRNALHFLLEESSTYIGIAAVRCLTSRQVELNGLAADGESPIAKYLKRFLDRSSHKAEIADYLFRSGADPSFQTADLRLNLGHLAASADEVGLDLLRTLADHGVDLRARDGKGRTLLHHCALAGSLEEEDALDFLCNDVGLSLESADDEGMTPMTIVTGKKQQNHKPLLFRSRRWRDTETLFLSSSMINE